MNTMKHWTQANTADFAYSISLGFFTQLEDRLEQSPMKRRDYAEKLGVTAGRISQILNNPPDNPQLESLVQYARALGMKVAVVAYDDGDPENDKGPIFSEVFNVSWERIGKPRDLISVTGAITPHAPYHETQQDFYRPETIVAPIQLPYMEPKAPIECIVAVAQVPITGQTGYAPIN